MAPFIFVSFGVELFERNFINSKSLLTLMAAQKGSKLDNLKFFYFKLNIIEREA